jgi:hypothetical protein
MLLDATLPQGAKDFFENPEFAIGAPLVLLGLLGALLVMSPLGARLTRGRQESTGEGMPLLIPLEPASLWLAGMVLGGVMVGLGIAFHPALIFGGVFTAVIAAVRWWEETAGPGGEAEG